MNKSGIDISCNNDVTEFNGIKLNDAIAYRCIGDTYVLVLTDHGQMVFINSTAGSIVEMFDQGVSSSNIPDEICRRFSIDKVTATQDYNSIRSLFMDLGILVPNNYSQIPAVSLSPASELSSDPRDRIKLYCTEEGVPLQAFIEMTPECNLRCTHCYVPFSMTSGKLLNLEAFKNLLDQLQSLGCLEVILTGGEPLSHQNLLEVCAYARQLRFSVVIKTNATLLDDTTLAAIRSMHVTEVQVSLYSMDPLVHDSITGQKGSHEKTIDALRRCHIAGQRCRLSCVVMRSNFRQLNGLKDFAQSIDALIGFDLLVTKRLDGSDMPLKERLSSEDLKWLDEQGVMANIIFEGSTQILKPDEDAYGLSRYPIDDSESRVCGAACTLLAIDSYGDVRPCIAFPMTLGNIQHNSLKDIFSNSNKVVRNIRTLRNSSFVECKGCSLISACPRCIATIYQETGSMVGKANAICEIATYHCRYGNAPDPTAIQPDSIS